MKGKRLIYIVSEIDKSLHFEWITPVLKQDFRLAFILIGTPDSALGKFLIQENVTVFSLSYRTKADIVSVWISVLRILIQHRPDIIHTHLWIANLTGLTAGWLARIRKRIYTRHHAMIHYNEFPSGLKWDKLCNWLATDIIAISRNVERILLQYDRTCKEKVTLIHHGFSFSYFRAVSHERIELLHKKYGIRSEQKPVIGVISRFAEWKGVQFVIPAFLKLREFFPNAHLVLANAHGPYEPVIAQLLALLPGTSFTRIPFENDLAAMYRLFDIFVHIPINRESEAFGQTYIEPLIVGVPSVFTLSGVAPEIIVDEVNALVVGYRDSEQLFERMRRLLQTPELREKLAHNGYHSIAGFNIDSYLRKLKGLYLR
jgi:glycosyltransferase involved in cell wall biosynthesis